VTKEEIAEAMKPAPLDAVIELQPGALVSVLGQPGLYQFVRVRSPHTVILKSAAKNCSHEQPNRWRP